MIIFFVLGRVFYYFEGDFRSFYEMFDRNVEKVINIFCFVYSKFEDFCFEKCNVYVKEL